jgi:hypothetical protein
MKHIKNFKVFETNQVDGVNDYYNDPEEQFKMWSYCQRNWDQDILYRILGADADGNPVKQQGIDNMLSQVDDYGDYSREEWKLFLQTVIEEGI